MIVSYQERKKSERIKYPFRKIDVYAVKIYRNNAYGNGTGNISAAGDFKLSGGGMYCQEGE